MKKDILPELNGKDYIESLNADYEIRFCREEEYAELVEFLKNYWKKDHIFTLSKELLDFQHLDQKNHRYNFVIAKHRISNEIHSILGFVPTNHYDEKIQNIMIWPCIWKSRDDIARKGLGTALYYYLKSALPIETFSILGISEKALSIYKHWNFETGKIEQYFFPNPNGKYVLSSGLEIFTCEKKERVEDLFILEKFSKEMFEKLPDDAKIFEELSNYKSKNYYVNRFFHHPIYQYFFYAIKDKEKVIAIIIMRVCGDSENKCVRIVDFIGSVTALSGISNQLIALMEERGYEYIDFMEVGLKDKELKDAGFKRRKDFPEVILPNYFEPFVKENIDLDYAYKTVGEDKKVIFFKADADQDRPNIK